MVVQRKPLRFRQAAIGSMGAVQDQEGAGGLMFFFLAMPPYTGAAEIGAIHLDPSNQSAYREVHVTPVFFDPGSTEGAGAGSQASTLFGDHLLQVGHTCAVPAKHGHKLTHQHFTGMKQSRQKNSY